MVRRISIAIPIITTLLILILIEDFTLVTL